MLFFWPLEDIFERKRKAVAAEIVGGANQGFGKKDILREKVEGEGRRRGSLSFRGRGFVELERGLLSWREAFRELLDWLGGYSEALYFFWEIQSI